MSETLLAVWVVAAASLVTHDDADIGQGVIRCKHDPKAVRQPVLLEARRKRRSVRALRETREREPEDDDRARDRDANTPTPHWHAQIPN
jgi:hypothetical protein